MHNLLSTPMEMLEWRHLSQQLLFPHLLLERHGLVMGKGRQAEAINNGNIITIDGENFSVPQGAYMKINEGMIK